MAYKLAFQSKGSQTLFLNLDGHLIEYFWSIEQNTKLERKIGQFSFAE